jgi:Uma2 family endonuclease
MAQREYPNIHVDDYLTLDQSSQNARYEYLEGELRMLAGGSADHYVYPDITVTCDPRDQEPEDNRIHYPSVVVEVLFPSTEVTDRGKKLLYYQAHPTIQEYILANSQSILIEIYRREKNKWTFSTYRLGDTITLESIGVEFSVSDVYKKTSLIRKAYQDR